MAVPHPAALSEDELLRDCSEIRTRRSGPGGQHRNRVETAVVLTHDTLGVSAEASERRSQAENRRVALFRLRVRLALSFRTDRQPDEPPGDLWRSRVRHRRIAVNPSHIDFPALLAEALDVLAASDWDVATAADRLEVTSTQLVRFLRQEPGALAQLNAERNQRGRRSLH